MLSLAVDVGMFWQTLQLASLRPCLGFSGTHYFLRDASSHGKPGRWGVLVSVVSVAHGDKAES